ncbi:MAG TPA: hypothetical protein VL979_13820 [Solirubrobacteraceae bacterium]|nr:hypothetical protein [Solirubrobacteraceae bacterium]
MPQQLFVFIQLEFPRALGPADGRYLLRRDGDGEPQSVVVLGTLDAAGRQLRDDAAGALGGGSLLRRLRAGSRTVAPEPEPAPVSTTRATVIDPVWLPAESQARAWLAELDAEREVGAAVARLNRVIHSHRVAAADPYVHDASPLQAVAIRAGWGEGEQVADGRWLHARALTWTGGPARRRSEGVRGRRVGRDRSWALRPQERLAALLAGRTHTLLCEEIVLRAREDLDQERPEQAALELDRAYAVGLEELRGEQRQDLAIRLAELEQLQPGVQQLAAATVARAAGRAARGAERDQDEPLDEELLVHALERLEAMLRARTAAGVEA